ncbi:group III truncated hemoglobin [Sulfurovum sp.]|uniref:group III truncated hemoglobin n=1 Tax=Sulfurovum sp. TaxID=1969726 RepID=UPI002867DE70|nr:group III truncated hemoglobin [Sulfurovum sp.]
MQAQEITQENIRTLVMSFYAKIIKDDIVGPFFIAKLGDDMKSEHWETHLETIVVFWSSLALGKPKYSGNLFLPHTQLGELKRETFEQWLKLFAETLDEVYVEGIAARFKERSMIIAGNFMRNLRIA